MRYFILSFFLIFSNIAVAQVMLPAYQGVQAVKSIALPILTTTAINGITGVGAVSGGNITDQGGAAITTRGICWNTVADPTIVLNTKTVSGSGVGTFVSNIIGLEPGTTYYVRAYAINAGGTAYGNQVSFTTAALAIGDMYQGGKVFYLLMPGDDGYDASRQHGLIRTEIRDYPFVTTTNYYTVVSDFIPNDNANNLFGHNDWRLPTIDEAMKICATGAFGNYESIPSSTDSTELPGGIFIARKGETDDCARSNTGKDNWLTRVMLIRQF